MSAEFPPNSRYQSVPVRTRTGPDGTAQTFVGRRIIPAVERYRVIDRYRTQADSRIDNVAADTFGDPEQYWRICDANGDAEPADATKPEGRLLAIPMPLEVTGGDS